MKRLEECLLYAIVDLGYVEPGDAADVTTQLTEGGADLIQLRAKGLSKERVAPLARVLHAITKRAGVPLILNDYPELLAEVEAEGCHLGPHASVEAARRQAGRDCLFGKSTHSPQEAVKAFQDGADYLGFGPLFASPTKPGVPAIGLADLPAAHAAVNVPIFGIGGVKLSNLEEVLNAGAKRVCVVSDLLQAPNIFEKTRSFKAILRGAATGL